ncbi:late embryogenesis abundant protein-related / LEA protein-related [Euphorbia peplus]|nr:late embryogenesis abundant protein-related / LEA protein-related [Euphorbia peplus]
MASQSLLDKSDDIGQAQLIREEHANQASHSHISQQVGQSGGDNSYSSQASNFIQQTGEQVKNMATGAANAMKSTLGMKATDDNISIKKNSNL